MKTPAASSATPCAAPRGRRGATAVSEYLVELLKPAARKRGFAGVDLFTRWPEIVGAAHAAGTRPERLSWPRRIEDGGEDGFEPATLTVRCQGGRALFFQHEVPQILERINAVFGFPAVGRIRIVQRPIETRERPRPPRLRALSAAEEARIAALTAPIADDGLREALARLGRAVVAAPERK
ncbi:DUF721 domain-containing protein [Siculibacillus lacustris]|nr:DciA family protein [Siculibacillus lacustris]